MIFDILPNQYESIAIKNTFRPWQMGILGCIFAKDTKDSFFTINMGSSAGHTYFSQVLASSDFPMRTKTYVTRQENLSEYSKLLFDDSKVHEPIGYLNDDSFSGYKGIPVEVVVIDMNGEPLRRFRMALERITQTTFPAKVLLLQGDHLI